MPKKDNIAIKSVIIGLVLMFATALVGGCAAVMLMHSISNKFILDKVIYSNQYDEYLAGKTLVTNEELEGINNNNEYISLVKIGNNKVEMVINTEYDQIPDVGFAGEWGVTDMYDSGYQEVVLFDCSYLFSYYYAGYGANGTQDCSDPTCTCSAMYNSIDGKNCIHNYYGNITSSTTQLTEEEARSALSATCPACYEIVETVTETGYEYSANIICSHSPMRANNGTYDKMFETTWTYFNLGDTPSTVSFRELVLDGYDFNELYEFLTNYDYTKYYPNAELYYNPTNFSHMFDGLMVEKITIKNATGLQNAKDLSYMFANCSNLKEIEFGNLFETAQPEDVSYMFYNCPNLTNINLTTLDTSKVTNMSNMFATGQGASAMTPQKREDIATTFLNQTIVPTMDETVNDGTIYTLESFANKMNELEETDTYTKDFVLLMLIAEGGLNLPVTYEEFANFSMGVSFKELVFAVQEDPTILDLAVKESGTYSYTEIMDHIKTMINIEIKLDIVYHPDLYAVNSRDEYIDYLINETLVPFYLGFDTSVKYTLDSLVEKMNEDVTEESDKITKEMLLIQASLQVGVQVPITYDEIVVAITGMTMDEILKQVNEDPASMDVEPKADGTPYTRADVENIIDLELGGNGLNIITVEELKNMYPKVGGKPQGKLVLGGQNSLFVIKEGTNVEGMFGTTNNFGSIVIPQMDSNVSINLPYTYKNDDNVTQTITNADSNKTYTYHVVEKPNEPAPKPWLTTGEIVAISVGGGSVVLGCIVALVLVIVVKKKPASRY